MSILQETVQAIIDGIDPTELEKTRELARTMDVDKMAGNAHHTMGQFLRNDLGLWQDSSKPLRLAIWENMSPERRARYDEHWKRYGKTYQGADMHADDASHELLVVVLNKIKEG